MQASLLEATSEAVNNFQKFVFLEEHRDGIMCQVRIFGDCVFFSCSVFVWRIKDWFSLSADSTERTVLLLSDNGILRYRRELVGIGFCRSPESIFFCQL